MPAVSGGIGRVFQGESRCDSARAVIHRRGGISRSKGSTDDLLTWSSLDNTFLDTALDVKYMYLNYEVGQF